MRKDTKGTVYLIGAGINKCIKGEDGISPPLSKSFFSTLFKKDKCAKEYYINKFSSVFCYIEKYWTLNPDSLSETHFDIGECFTLLQLQILEALDEKRYLDAYELIKINSLFKVMFIENLYPFQKFAKESSAMVSFGKRICENGESIITFNYDCNLEKAIEYATGISAQNSQCYGVYFDEVKMQEENNLINGKINNQSLKGFEILKLHGSLNWVNYIELKDDKKINIDGSGKVVLTNKCWWQDNEIYTDKGIMDPLIIPPVLYKDYRQKLIHGIWKKAKDKLKSCKELVIIGYSFPITDFSIKKLLLESFQGRELENLIWVNPNTTAIEDVKRILHYNKPIILCSCLEEFVK